MIRRFVRAILSAAMSAFATCGCVPIISNGFICFGPARPTPRPLPGSFSAEAHRLQDVFMAEFRVGLTGNQLLAEHPFPGRKAKTFPARRSIPIR